MVKTKETLFSWEKSFNLEFNDILMVPNQPTIKLMRIHFMDEQLSLKAIILWLIIISTTCEAYFLFMMICSKQSNLIMFLMDLTKKCCFMWTVESANHEINDILMGIK